MNDLDLEDIESHLYSQIYHSNERSEEDIHTVTLENIEEHTNNMGNPNRYFQKNKKDNDSNQTRMVINYLEKFNPAVQKNRKRHEYFYTKDSGRPFRPLDVPFSQAFVHRGNSKGQPIRPLDVPFIQPFALKSRSRKRKDRRAAARRFKAQQHIAVIKPRRPPQNEVITLSDSDGESVVEVANKWPTLAITDSDEEVTNEKTKNHQPPSFANDVINPTPIDTGDDVIFIEPTNAPVEVINIDEEVDTTPQKSPEEVSAHADVETASVASSSNSFINAYSLTKSSSPKKPHQERGELLSTPDSASNDFVNNTAIEAEKNDFNFSLHGQDFDGQFVKPTNPGEVCETESSSSTTDHNILNTMKTIVFNEVEFPKEGIFSETNLESFGNFITPLRKSAVKRMTQISTPVDNTSPSHTQNLYSSDSSSESDFDEADVDSAKELSKKSKNLPELSPMIAETRALRAVKKTKKTLNLSSKYDLLNTNSLEMMKAVKSKKRNKSNLVDTSSEEGAAKKKSRSKKRKSNMKCNKSMNVFETEENSAANSSVNDLNTDQDQLNTSVKENIPDEEMEGEPRQKKKKSREILDEMNENLDIGTSKKKAKTKKRRSLTETEPAENIVSDVESSVPQQQASSDQNEEKNTENINPSSSEVPPEPLQINENTDIGHSKKKTKTKKKKSATETESTEDHDLDSSIAQQDSSDKNSEEDQNAENLNATSSEPHQINENTDIGHTKKKTKTKKKRSFTETGSTDENSEDPSVPQQQDQENLIPTLSEVLPELHHNHTENIGHSKKKTKKKRSFTEPEPDDNVSNAETSTQAQEDSGDRNQVKEDPIDDNLLPTSSVVQSEPTEAHQEPIHIKREEEDVQLAKEMTKEIPNVLPPPVVKIEPDVAVAPQDQKEQKETEAVETLDEIEIKIESSNDIIALDDTAEDRDIQLVLSSDSESNLSELDGHQDIQLNCEESRSQEISTAINQLGMNSDVFNLTRCSVVEVQQHMSNDPKLWAILDIDRMPPIRNPAANRRCNRCREKGHMAVKCPNQVEPKCRLCGEQGHFEPRCPNRICTQCGMRRPYSTTSCSNCVKFKTHRCELCNMVGHPAAACPDLWRRYHLTTTDGPLNYINGPSLLKPRNQLWCSGCARPGHLEYACRYYKSMYPPSDPRIRSYEDVYQDRGGAEVEEVAQPFSYTFNNDYKANYDLPPPQAQRYPPVYQNQSNYGVNSYVENRVDNTGFYNDNNDYQNQNWHDDQEFFFEDNLPNFISFEAPPVFNFDSAESLGRLPPKSRYFTRYENVQGRRDDVRICQRKQNRGVFFSQPVEKVRQLIVDELQDLFKVTRQLDQIVRNLKSQPVNQNSKKMRKYNKTLNMILFGIYKLHEGGKHLVKLKQFKIQPLKARLSEGKRRDLHNSYLYIFSSEKHGGIDYDELLRKI